MDSVNSKIKIAIVHDYLNQFGGAERCLEQLHSVFPSAPIYTLVYDEKVLPQFKDWDIRPSFLQCIPGSKQLYRFFIPFFPFVVKTFDLSHYDIVLSVSHAWVKGIRKRNARHICYCLTPIRYAWDLYEDYVKYEYIPRFVKPFLPIIAFFLRFWDKHEAQKTDTFITISRAIQQRVSEYYRRDSKIIYPPVDVDFYHVDNSIKRKEFYLTVSRLKAYKRIDLIVDAFNELGKELHVVGNGPDIERLKKRANSNVKFLTGLSDKEVRSEYRRAKGFVYAGLEDFGIVLAEAQACGLPVIAFGRGGALDIVKKDVSGVFFDEQNVESLMDAIERFEKIKFGNDKVRDVSLKFDQKIFCEKMLELVKEAVS